MGVHGVVGQFGQGQLGGVGAGMGRLKALGGLQRGEDGRGVEPLFRAGVLKAALASAAVFGAEFLEEARVAGVLGDKFTDGEFEQWAGCLLKWIRLSGFIDVQCREG